MATLPDRYKKAGFTGGCSKDALQLLRTGVVELLQRRGDSGAAFTDAEFDKVRPNGTPVSLAWCQKLAGIVKIELQV